MQVPELALTSSAGLAFALGALHVLEPAHGRSIINALLVGSSGRKGDVLKFGLSVVVSHLGVAAVLAAAAWYVGHHFGAHVLGPAFKVAGSLITVAIGLVMLSCGKHSHTTCVHKHHGIEDQHDPQHEEEHARHMLQAHLTNPAVLGFAGGLIPCQGTIALITVSMGTGDLSSAVWLLLAFAAGLGLCLVLVGLLTAMAQPRALALAGRLGRSRLLAYAPGAVVTVLGVLALALSVMEVFQPHAH